MALEPIRAGDIIFACPCTDQLTRRDRRAAIAAAATRGQKPAKAVRDRIDLLYHSTFNEEDQPQGYYKVPDITAKVCYLWRPTNTELAKLNNMNRNVELIFMENLDPALNPEDQPLHCCMLIGQASIIIDRDEVLVGPRPSDKATYPDIKYGRSDLPVDRPRRAEMVPPHAERAAALEAAAAATAANVAADAAAQAALAAENAAADLAASGALGEGAAGPSRRPSRHR